MIQFKPFERSNPANLAAASAVWNAAVGGELSISPTLIAYNTQSFSGVQQEGRMAFDGRRPVGFVLASRAEGVPEAASPDQGFIDLTAVHPDFQRRGVGSQLVDWAEGWLKRGGASKVQLGGGLPAFAPGVPDELHAQGFFQQRGYKPREENPYEWDVARSMAEGPPIIRPEAPGSGGVSPARPTDKDRLDEFFTREFPGRWHYEFSEFIRLGGRLADFLLLHREDRIYGFAWITLDDSIRPLERYYPHRLPQPWSQIGPIGISKEMRGSGWGGFLLQSALFHLRSRHVRSVVVDWTSLLGFYEKYGLKPYRRYVLMAKNISSE
jgi:GNAT superfamily N-acetyltransferase